MPHKMRATDSFIFGSSKVVLVLKSDYMFRESKNQPLPVLNLEQQAWSRSFFSECEALR